MLTKICRKTFSEARANRLANRPFDRVSAYKVRECRDRLRDERAVVGAVADYLKDRGSYYRPSLLLGCTTADKAIRLKQVPHNIVMQFGENLIPAIEALHVEGVPIKDVCAFCASIQPRVQQLIDDCDAIQAATRRSIKGEYANLKAGSSSLTVACADAVAIADQAVLFCRQHGVL